jgi:hypothetical protein
MEKRYLIMYRDKFYWWRNYSSDLKLDASLQLNNYRRGYIHFGFTKFRTSMNFLIQKMEAGFSVYEALFTFKNDCIPIIPDNGIETPGIDSCLCSLSGMIERVVFEVKGTVIEMKGGDGEPLMQNHVFIRQVQIINELFLPN